MSALHWFLLLCAVFSATANARDYAEKPPAGMQWGWQSGVLFDFDSAKIRADQQVELDRVADILTLSPHVEVLLSGRADTTGKSSHNQSLSRRRAQAVAAYLVRRGVENTRIHQQFFGEDRPVADNAQKTDRRRNRRVDMAFFPRGNPPPQPTEEMLRDGKAEEEFMPKPLPMPPLQPSGTSRTHL